MIRRPTHKNSRMTSVPRFSSRESAGDAEDRDTVKATNVVYQPIGKLD